MSYELQVTDEASADLQRLLEAVPTERRNALIDAIERELEMFVSQPLKKRGKRLSCPLHVTADDVRYYWGATFVYSEDERSLVITHVYRTSVF